ncbi:MAG: hypothetical protein GC178_03295 [Flavobacteriales bacterium]|nr:hypothetical protein [Flavobacteriales bacterium]
MDLSIVAVGRNDDYGGDFRLRLQTFVRWTFHHLTEARIRSELIFVNYNPVDGSPIEDFIEWPRSNQWVDVRIVTVPGLIHKETVAESKVKDVPVLEYVAKNVGIRRARGRFIMAMNPDIVMSEALFPKLKKLKKGTYYRANRSDHTFEGELTTTSTVYEQLRNHVRTVWFKGSHEDFENFSMSMYLKQWARKWFENKWRGNTVYFEAVLNYFSIPVYYHNIEYRLHCNASGDLMLMHRDHWAQLKGYKENSLISLHVDSLMVIQAAFSGLREKVFVPPIYHKHHVRRFDAIGKDDSDQRFVYQQFKNDVEAMVRSGRPVIYNTDSWGLAAHDLPETLT